ncbi:MAG: DUF2461 domain-containing protein [Bacteroidota bacterium]
MSALSPTILPFLKDLKANNNREWFEANKSTYRTAHADMAAFMDDLLEEMRKIDLIENESGKKSLFRIYRDVRFSKDKSPYKTNFAGHIKRATSALRGGYYLQVEPENIFIAAGFFMPESADLKRIREAIASDDKPLRSILDNPDFSSIWGTFDGERVKTAPKGFSKDHPAIDLIRFKQFHLSHTYTEKEALDESFSQHIAHHFLVIRPYFDYMSEILTAE